MCADEDSTEAIARGVRGATFSTPAADQPTGTAPGAELAGRLLGPNGAGKSTLIDMMLGLIRPDDGSVEVFGMSPEAAVRDGRVGAMPQDGQLPPDLTGRGAAHPADRIVVVQHGRVVADGATAEIKAIVSERAVRVTLPTPEPAEVRALPGAIDVEVRGSTVELRCADSDATLRVRRSGLAVFVATVLGMGVG